MVSAYNFIASWQLFPEKGSYENGSRPKSGYFQITTGEDKNYLTVNNSWVTLENASFAAKYDIVIDDSLQPFYDADFATHVRGKAVSTIRLEISFLKNDAEVLNVIHEIEPNGYLKLTQTGIKDDGQAFTNIEFFHKQMSVLPYSASVSGVAIRPTKEAVIKHKVLSAMEEQTNMQLEQIRRQVELLALQAQEIQSRKELSMIVYGTKMTFLPVIGNVYHLYQNQDDKYMISMIGPNEWGRSGGNIKSHYAKIQLLADHTWKEVV